MSILNLNYGWKQGKKLFIPAETGYLMINAKLSEQPNADLSRRYPHAIYIKGTPEKAFYYFLEKNFNQACL